MAKEEPPSVSEDLQNLRRKMSLLIKSFQNNSKVVAFTKSPVGQYLDRHPFLALSMLVFMALSAVPVGLFGLVVVLSSLAALVGVLLLEGLDDRFSQSCSPRTGHFRGWHYTALCPLWLGLHITCPVRGSHRVLCGGLQPHQLLVFFQGAVCKPKSTPGL
ncbi:promethin isoform X3 [Fukomys damarensis]|uniref:promethin isoform X3 n=1 Tax=Fukomys damarensis TaxID=885580 RepID=UPI001454FE4E|nr:promethin isoform X3 [Fukomys damarensis]XP_033614406.1 promethin isoform X3 [Fukomys damarensis]XP_033614407.1 promethin isoform X3 [Fukomys damarensis]XP_033614408.1 promethin isoform X3 [Fukomys damarensis]